MEWDDVLRRLACGFVRGVERVGQGVAEAGEQVAVAVERHRDRGVAEPFLDRLRVRAGRDQKRGACVSEVVEAEPRLRRREGRFDGGLELPLVEDAVL